MLLDLATRGTHVLFKAAVDAGVKRTVVERMDAVLGLGLLSRFDGEFGRAAIELANLRLQAMLHACG